PRLERREWQVRRVFSCVVRPLSYFSEVRHIEPVTERLSDHLSCVHQSGSVGTSRSSPLRLNNIPQSFTIICLIGRVSSQPRRRSSGEELSSFGYPIQRYAINFQS